MAHQLEFITKDKMFTAGEMIESKIDALLSRLFDYQINLDTTEKEVIESWRNELIIIRSAIRKITEIIESKEIQ